MAIKSYVRNGKKCYDVQVKMRDPKGRQLTGRKRNVSSLAQARKVQFELQKKLELKISGGLKIWTWKDWHTECLRRMSYALKQKTVVNYASLNRWLPEEWLEKRVDLLSKADMHYAIFEHLKDEITENARKNIHRRVLRILEMAVEEGIVGKNVAKGIQVKVPEVKQLVLNATEANLLLSQAKERDHPFYPIWTLALLTGMRSGELYALQWKDIDFESDLISVTRQWTSKDGLHATKSGRNRMVPMNSELRSFLKQLRGSGSFQDQVFDARLKQEVHLKDLVLPRFWQWKKGRQADVLQKFCREIGLPPIKFHDLRATFITGMLSQGVPLVTVMAIVGHSKTETTDRYVRLAGIGIKGSTQALPFFVPKPKTAGNVVQLFS